jgi:hypothetical protein
VLRSNGAANRVKLFSFLDRPAYHQVCKLRKLSESWSETSNGWLYSLTEEDASLRLRDESRFLHRPMRDLAEAVILAAGLEKTDPEEH